MFEDIKIYPVEGIDGSTCCEDVLLLLNQVRPYRDVEVLGKSRSQCVRVCWCVRICVYD